MTDERAERLAAALRANLRRRKAQARGDAPPPAPPAPPVPLAPQVPPRREDER